MEGVREGGGVKEGREGGGVMEGVRGRRSEGGEGGRRSEIGGGWVTDSRYVFVSGRTTCTIPASILGLYCSL